MHTIEKIVRDDVWWDHCLEIWLVIVGRGNNTVVEVVVSHGFDCRFIKNHSREANRSEYHLTVGGKCDLIETAIFEGETKVDIEDVFTAVCLNVHFMGEGQQNILMAGIQKDSS